MKKLLISLLFLLGCSSQTLDLDSKWLPLETVKESNVIPEHTVTTICPYLLVHNLEGWQSKYPEGVKRDALLFHEQSHAIKQKEMGLTKFLAKYIMDKKFRWLEESAGWALELKYLKAHGVVYSSEAVALALSKNYQGMISYKDALDWVRKL